jgi:CubicO group peptidase (beta-lactamase class C family)
MYRLGCLLLMIWYLPGLLAAETVNEAKLAAVESALSVSIASGNTPGAVVWLEGKEIQEQLVRGDAALLPARRGLTADAVFDAASLTKVMATAPCVMKLIQDGRVGLEDLVSKHLPDFTGEGRELITVRHLLTHTSGLPPGIPREPAWSGYEEGIRRAIKSKPESGVDVLFRYSDVNFILLGEMVRRVANKPLNECAREWIYAPLGMKSTQYLPARELLGRVVPTEADENGKMLHGVVHDPTARRMGGVAGHAGLFTSAEDVARYARALLKGSALLSAETVKLMTSNHIVATVPERRGLGWDMDSRYSRQRGRVYPVRGFGHTGWTGTAMWVDPASESFFVMLTSRLHADGEGEVRTLGETVGTLAGEMLTDSPMRATALTDFDKTVPSVLNGVDVVERDGLKVAKGKRVGLITNHTGINRDRVATIDVLKRQPGVKLVALFSPEHGIRGTLDQEKITDGKDAKTGLPIYSLYGERRHPSEEQLKLVDVLVFDIQDIGTRFYTYIATMKASMEAAARAGKTFVVLDRVNPINGLTVEGPAMPAEKTFTACHAIPVRHGMTAGELAQMFKQEQKWTLDLHIVRCDGWRRMDWFDATGLPWQNPSPNMRSLTAATLYPGIGFLEFAISVGRGTDAPFEARCAFCRGTQVRTGTEQAGSERRALRARALHTSSQRVCQ